MKRTRGKNESREKWDNKLVALKTRRQEREESQEEDDGEREKTRAESG